MSTFHVYQLDSLEYLGSLEATDSNAAGQLAAAVWPVPLKVLNRRLRRSDGRPE